MKNDLYDLPILDYTYRSVYTGKFPISIILLYEVLIYNPIDNNFLYSIDEDYNFNNNNIFRYFEEFNNTENFNLEEFSNKNKAEIEAQYKYFNSLSIRELLVLIVEFYEFLINESIDEDLKYWYIMGLVFALYNEIWFYYGKDDTAELTVEKINDELIKELFITLNNKILSYEEHLLSDSKYDVELYNNIKENYLDNLLLTEQELDEYLGLN